MPRFRTDRRQWVTRCSCRPLAGAFAGYWLAVSGHVHRFAAARALPNVSSVHVPVVVNPYPSVRGLRTSFTGRGHG